jgi:hypothetical protein
MKFSSPRRHSASCGGRENREPDCGNELITRSSRAGNENAPIEQGGTKPPGKLGPTQHDRTPDKTELIDSPLFALFS